MFIIRICSETLTDLHCNIIHSVYFLRFISAMYTVVEICQLEFYTNIWMYGYGLRIAPGGKQYPVAPAAIFRPLEPCLG